MGFCYQKLGIYHRFSKAKWDGYMLSVWITETDFFLNKQRIPTHKKPMFSLEHNLSPHNNHRILTHSWSSHFLTLSPLPLSRLTALLLGVISGIRQLGRCSQRSGSLHALTSGSNTVTSRCRFVWNCVGAANMAEPRPTCFLCFSVPQAKHIVHRPVDSRVFLQFFPRTCSHRACQGYIYVVW